MMFSAAHDPEGTKSYEACKEMAGEYVEAGRMHMAFLLEEANSKEDKVMKDQVEGSSPGGPTISHIKHSVMKFRPSDWRPLV